MPITRPSVEQQTNQDNSRKEWCKMSFPKTVLIALALLVNGCAPTSAAKSRKTNSNLHFISFGDKQLATLKAMRSSIFKLCVQNQGFSGSMETQKANALQGLLVWYRAVRQIDPAIKNNIIFNCDNADVKVNVTGGGGRSYAQGNSITLMAGNGDGSILHEYGHAFAGLADTYDTGTGQAGACVQGQPKSVMCWGMYGKHDSAGHSLLYDDDAKGIQANYKSVFPEFAKAVPDTSIDPTAPLDVNNPWPAAGGGGGGDMNGLFALLAESTDVNAAAVYISTATDIQSVAVCMGKSDVCSAPDAQTYSAAPTTLPGVKDRLVFLSPPVPLTVNGAMTFIVTDKQGKRTVAKSISLKPAANS